LATVVWKNTLEEAGFHEIDGGSHFVNITAETVTMIFRARRAQTSSKEMK
jgi:hypothetical protein